MVAGFKSDFVAVYGEAIPLFPVGEAWANVRRRGL
jgi:hypothetical protein